MNQKPGGGIKYRQVTDPSLTIIVNLGNNSAAGVTYARAGFREQFNPYFRLFRLSTLFKSLNGTNRIPFPSPQMFDNIIVHNGNSLILISGKTKIQSIINVPKFVGRLKKA